jgi:hypothetical protein
MSHLEPNNVVRLTSIESLILKWHRSGLRLRLHRGQLRYSKPINVQLADELSEVRARRDDVITFLNGSVARAHFSGAHSVEVFPASRIQRWWWDQERVLGSTRSQAFAITISGRFSRSVICDGLRELVARHEILRTRFVYSDGYLFQFVNDNVLDRVEAITFNDANEEFINLEIGRRLEDMRRVEYDLTEGNLFRCAVVEVAPDLHIALFGFHHIIGDGRSTNLVMKEIGEVLEGRFIENRPDLRLPIDQYSTFVEFEEHCIGAAEDTRPTEYWRRRFSLSVPTGNVTRVADGLDIGGGRVTAFREGRISARLSGERVDAVYALCKRLGITFPCVALALYKLATSRWLGEDELVIGVYMHGRPTSQFWNTLGCFAVNRPIVGNCSAETELETYVRAMWREYALAIDIATPIDWETSYHVRLNRIIANFPARIAVASADKGVNAASADKGINLSFGSLNFYRPRGEETSFVYHELSLTILDAPQGIDITLSFAEDKFQHGDVRLLMGRVVTGIAALPIFLNSKVSDLMGYLDEVHPPSEGM